MKIKPFKGTIYPRGKSFSAQWTDAPKHRQAKMFPSYAEAEAYLMSVSPRPSIKGHLPPTPPHRAVDVLEEMTEYDLQRGLQPQYLAKRHRCLLRCINAVGNPRWVTISYIASLDPLEFRRFVHSPIRSPETEKSYLERMKKLLYYARDCGYLGGDPESYTVENCQHNGEPE